MFFPYLTYNLFKLQHTREYQVHPLNNKGKYMEHSDLQKDLEYLQQQVNELKQVELAATENQKQQQSDDKMIESLLEDQQDNIPNLAEIKKQFELLTDELSDKINEIPTVTCLSIFIAGILFGRGLK